jgi:hypothetical protein
LTQVVLRAAFADLHRVLGADEAKVVTELSDEAPEIAQKRAMKVGLGVILRQ